MNYSTSSIRNSKFVNIINRFICSDYFLILFSLVVFISWLIEIEFIAISVAFLTLCYMFLFQKDLDRLVPIAIILPSMVYANFMAKFSTIKLYILIVMVAIVILLGVYFAFRKDILSRKINFLKSNYFIGYIFATLALAIGGIGYIDHSPLHSIIALGIGLIILALYYLVLNYSNTQTKITIFKSIVCLATVSTLELISFCLRIEDVFSAISQKSIILGWAITNSVACILGIAIPLCFYLAQKKKFQLGYLFLATIFYLSIFLTNCRSMQLIGTAIFFVSLIYSFFKCDKKQYFLNIFITASIVCVTYILLKDKLLTQFNYLGFDDNGRKRLWDYYLGLWKENKALGIGLFSDNYNYLDHIVRAHNTPLQILVSTGIIGSVLFLPYYYQRYKSFVVRPSTFKIFALLSYLAVAGYGLVDCAVISSYKLIIVHILMTAVELEDIDLKSNNLTSKMLYKSLFNKEYKLK